MVDRASGAYVKSDTSGPQPEAGGFPARAVPTWCLWEDPGSTQPLEENTCGRGDAGLTTQDWLKLETLISATSDSFGRI